MDATIRLKPQVLPEDLEEGKSFVPDPDTECLLRVEVEGLGSFRVLLSVQPTHHNMGEWPVDVLIATVWKTKPNGKGDDDPDDGVLPVWAAEEDDDEETGAGEGGQFEEDVVLVPGPAPGEGEEEEDEGSIPEELAEMGSEPECMWLFEPTHGFLTTHPAAGCYCPVCGWRGNKPAFSPCPECKKRNGPPPDLRAAARIKPKREL